MTDVSRCARGHRCYASERDDTQPGSPLVGAPCDRPLCDVCETAVHRVLDDSPALYVALRNATLTRTVGAKASDHVKRSAGHPLPLNGRALDLGEQLWWLLTTWEDEVRIIAKLTPAQRDGKREGPQVVDAAALLAAHLTAWISAPLTAFAVARWADELEQSGAQAACALLDWRKAVRVALEGPGPKPAARCWITLPSGHQCGGPIWVHDHYGYCGDCDARWDGADFLRLAAVLHQEAA